MTNDEDYLKHLKPRGISRDVAEEAFFSYTDSLDVGTALWRAGGKSSRVAERRAERAPGMIMVRFAVPGGDELAGSPISPEMRPARAILTAPHPQRHKIIHHHRSMKPHELRKHLERSKADAESVRKGCTGGEYDKIKGWLWPAEWAVTEGGDHYGQAVDRDVLHAHIHIAKYLFAASPTKTVDIARHVHSEVYPEMQEPWDGDTDQPVSAAMKRWDWHVGKHHMDWKAEPPFGEEVLPGWDEEHGHPANIKDDRYQVARRLSWHPYRREERWQRDRVFFALEGSMKEAALVKAGEATFSAPSVTLWDAPELRIFAEDHLRGKTVYVVCDSDWEEIEAVTRQTLMARDRLRLLLGSKDVHAAAPPVGRGGKQGIDDFLGKGGGRVADMDVWDLVPGVDLDAELRERSTRRLRQDGHARNLLFFRWIVTHASPKTGQTRVALRTVAKALRPELGDRTQRGAEEAVKRAFQAMDDDGLLIVKEKLDGRIGWTSLGVSREWTGLLEVPERLRARVVRHKLEASHVKAQPMILDHDKEMQTR